MIISRTLQVYLGPPASSPRVDHYALASRALVCSQGYALPCEWSELGGPSPHLMLAWEDLMMQEPLSPEVLLDVLRSSSTLRAPATPVLVERARALLLRAHLGAETVLEGDLELVVCQLDTLLNLTGPLRAFMTGGALTTSTRSVDVSYLASLVPSALLVGVPGHLLQRAPLPSRATLEVLVAVWEPWGGDPPGGGPLVHGGPGLVV